MNIKNNLSYILTDLRKNYTVTVKEKNVKNNKHYIFTVEGIAKIDNESKEFTLDVIFEYTKLNNNIFNFYYSPLNNGEHLIEVTSSLNSLYEDINRLLEYKRFDESYLNTLTVHMINESLSKNESDDIFSILDKYQLSYSFETKDILNKEITSIKAENNFTSINDFLKFEKEILNLNENTSLKLENNSIYIETFNIFELGKIGKYFL